MSALNTTRRALLGAPQVKARWNAVRAVNQAANDNAAGRQPDRWALLIARLGTVSESLAISAWRCRASGWSVDEFCDSMIRAYEARV